MTSPLHTAPIFKVLAGQARPATRIIPEEVPVALVHDGITHAVMMATPTDLEDFALGFAITEGVARPDQIREVEVAEQPDGWEVRLWLAPDAGREVTARRRAILGPTGCGLCGVESLEAAVPPPPRVAEGARFTIAQVMAAMASLKPAQRLNAEAHALHAAGFWTPAGGLVALREDVGRHNALDKLVGALARSGTDAGSGIVLLSSRISVEMVQKAARLGAPALAAASAPTALALRTGEAAGMTLIGIARSDGFEVFTRPDRLDLSGGETREAILRQADKLVRMANDIARNLAPQGEATAAHATADHIRRFWDPRMRAGLLAYAAEDGSGLSPIARAAVAEIAEPA